MKPKYLIGYKGERNCLYGKNRNGKPMFVDGFTDIRKARNKIKEFISDDYTAVIYKLVPVEEKKVKEYR